MAQGPSQTMSNSLSASKLAPNVKVIRTRCEREKGRERERMEGEVSKQGVYLREKTIYLFLSPQEGHQAQAKAAAKRRAGGSGGGHMKLC